MLFDAGVAHAQRVEDAALGKLVQRLAGDALHHLGQQREVGIAVQVFAARGKIQRPLLGDGPLQVFHGDGVIDAHALHHQQLPLVADARDVVHQLVHRDRLRKSHQVAHILPDIGLDIQLALFPQQQGAQHGDLFGDRRHVEHRILCDGHLVLQVGVAKAFVIDHFAPVADQHLAARAQPLLPQVEDLIQFLFGRVHFVSPFSA